MKCPQCMINYEDSERECPMCGARKPTSRTGAPQSSRSAERPPAEYSDESPQPAGRTTRPSTARKKHSPLLTVVIIFVLLQLLPFIFGGLSYLLTEVQESEFFGISMVPDYQNHAVPEREFDEEDFPYAGIWRVDDALEMALALAQTPDDAGELRYVMSWQENTEAGYYFTYPCTSADGWSFPDAYPEESFTWWMVQLAPVSVFMQSDAAYSLPDNYGEVDANISIFQSRENPEELYFISELGDMPWLTQNESTLMEHIGDGQAADALTAQYGIPDAA